MVLYSATNPLTVAQGSGVELQWFNGSGAAVLGNRTLAGGGVCTLTRVTAAVWRIFGTGVS
jgi:hypothetical protein